MELVHHLGLACLGDPPASWKPNLALKPEVCDENRSDGGLIVVVGPDGQSKDCCLEKSHNQVSYGEHPELHTYKMPMLHFI